MKAAIGVDIGGSKISLILGTQRGKVLSHRIIPTRTGSQARQGVRELTLALKELITESGIKKRDILGIGIGVPGAVDTRRGVVPRSPNMKGWSGIRLKEIVSRAVGLPVFLANDANVAVLAEKIFGQAKKAENFVYVTASTGIGGGLFLHGRLLEGASYVSGEIGHAILIPGGNPCNCGNQGCLEAYASGSAIARYIETKIRQGRKTSLKISDLRKHGRFSARAVGQFAKRGDRLALEAYRVAGAYLGIGIANLLNIINPEMVILGGGVWHSAPGAFWNAMIQSCAKNAWPEAFKAVKIVRSNLVGSVGDLGALALVFEKSKNNRYRFSGGRVLMKPVPVRTGTARVRPCLNS